MDTRAFDGGVRRDPKKMVVFVSGTLLLVATWCFLSLFVWVATEGWLVPWDCLNRAERPPLGSWERTVNDFFEVPPGSILPGVVFTVVSASIFVVRTVKATDRAVLPWVFAGTNIIFFLVVSFAVIRAHELPDLWLPQPRPPIDVGYHRTWPAILTTTVLVGVLFLVQSRIAFGGKRGGR